MKPDFGQFMSLTGPFHFLNEFLNIHFKPHKVYRTKHKCASHKLVLFFFFIFHERKSKRLLWTEKEMQGFQSPRNKTLISMNEDNIINRNRKEERKRKNDLRKVKEYYVQCFLQMIRTMVHIQCLYNILIYILYPLLFFIIIVNIILIPIIVILMINSINTTIANNNNHKISITFIFFMLVICGGGRSGGNGELTDCGMCIVVTH